MLGSNEGIKLVIIDSKVVDIIFVNIDGITVGIDDVTYMGSFDWSVDNSNDGKLEV